MGSDRRRLPLVPAGAALGVPQAPEADQAEGEEHDGQDDTAQRELLSAVIARLKRMANGRGGVA